MANEWLLEREHFQESHERFTGITTLHPEDVHTPMRMERKRQKNQDVPRTPTCYEIRRSGSLGSSVETMQLCFHTKASSHNLSTIAAL